MSKYCVINLLLCLDKLETLMSLSYRGSISLFFSPFDKDLSSSLTYITTVKSCMSTVYYLPFSLKQFFFLNHNIIAIFFEYKI